MVYRSRCKPVRKLHFCTLFKKQGKFSTFRTNPKPVLAPISIHMRINSAIECFIIYPPKTFPFVTISSRGKYLALIFWRNDHFGQAIITFKKYQAILLFQKIQVITKGALFEIVSLVVVIIFI